MERYDQTMRVCAYVNLDLAIQNMRNMHANLKNGTQMVAVIKANGYGHGAVALAKALEPENYLWGFAVATIEEAKQLREEAKVTKPILILGYTFSYAYPSEIQEGIRPAIFTYEMARELSDKSAELGLKCKIHIKVDTGMGRIGVPCSEEGVTLVKKIASLPGIEIEGIFTHFAKADEYDKTFTNKQIQRFENFVESLEQNGVSIPLKHCSNSAGILEISSANMDMVRAGITLYGLWPSEEVSKEIVKLEPLMTLKSHIVYIKTLPKGTPISYGGTYVTNRETRVATVPVGYGDGYPRMLTGKGEVLVCGQRCKILGRICMDQFMIDITDVPQANLHDEVTLIGKDKEECITMEELGDLSGRFNYELACCITSRVPRVYIQNNKCFML